MRPQGSPTSTLETVLPVFGDRSSGNRGPPQHPAAHPGEPQRRPISRATSYYRDALDGCRTGTRRRSRHHHDDPAEFQQSPCLRWAMRQRASNSRDQVRSIGLAAAEEPHPIPCTSRKFRSFVLSGFREGTRFRRRARTGKAGGRDLAWPLVLPMGTLSEAHYPPRRTRRSNRGRTRALSLPDGLHIAGEERYLVRLFTEKGDSKAAEEFLRNHLERRREARPPDDPLIGHTLAPSWEGCCWPKGTSPTAIDRAGECPRHYDRTMAADHGGASRCSVISGAAHTLSGTHDEAVSFLALAQQLASPQKGYRLMTKNNCLKSAL